MALGPVRCRVTYAPMHSVAPNGLTPRHDTIALILHQILCIPHLGNNPSAPTIGKLQSTLYKCYTYKC